jgi:hypothetical protein
VIDAREYLSRVTVQQLKEAIDEGVARHGENFLNQWVWYHPDDYKEVPIHDLVVEDFGIVVRV